MSEFLFLKERVSERPKNPELSRIPKRGSFPVREYSPQTGWEYIFPSVKPQFRCSSTLLRMEPK